MACGQTAQKKELIGRNLPLPQGRKVLNILFVIGQLGFGGSERQLYYLLRILDRSCFRATVLVWNFNHNDQYLQRIRELDVEVIYPSVGNSFLTKILEFRAIVQRYRIDVVHSYSFYLNGACWLAAIGYARAVGAIRCNYWIERENLTVFRRRFCSSLPRIHIANSRHAVDQVCSHRSILRPGRVCYLPNVVDLSLYPTSPLPQDSPIRILGIGRLYPQKAWHVLLEAMTIVMNNSSVVWELAIIGDGPLRSELEAYVDKTFPAGLVKFLGEVSDVGLALQKCHFLVHSSIFEGCPNVVLEALASGRPVVATAAGDISDIVLDGVSGFVTAQGDSIGMAERIKLLIENPTLLSEMAGRAREVIETKYSYPSLNDRFSDVYRSLGLI